MHVPTHYYTMNTTDELSICANCGKEGSNLNTCNKCKLVKYCNAACKKKHRSKHKKKCERRVAELFDIELFKQPPINEECPICFLPMPRADSGKRYKSCCAKNICSGCMHAVDAMYKERKCPFCRTVTAMTGEDCMIQTRKRVEVNDAVAIHMLGLNYHHGQYGLPKDYTKALELFTQAAELGHTDAYYDIGNAYFHGWGVGTDHEKARHNFELAAIGGHSNARNNLGLTEEMTAMALLGKANSEEFFAKKMDRAVRHYIIGVRLGEFNTLKNVHRLFMCGFATKDDYTKALRAYQEYVDEIRSDQRDAAAAISDNYRYYGEEKQTGSGCCIQ